MSFFLEGNANIPDLWKNKLDMASKKFKSEIEKTEKYVKQIAETSQSMCEMDHVLVIPLLYSSIYCGLFVKGVDFFTIPLYS